MNDRKTDRIPDHGAAAAWWREFDSHGDRGAMARLRRASFPTQAWGVSETMVLYRRLGFRQQYRESRLEPVAILAIVLAGVKEDARGSLGMALGGESPVLHPLRVRRLAVARDGAETLRGFREAVALLKGKAPVADLARNVLGWLDPLTRDRTRTRFLFDYHGAGFAAPGNDPEQSDESSQANDTTESWT